MITYTLIPGESSVQNLHIPPLLVPVLRFLADVAVVVLTRCLTVLPLVDLGATAFEGDLLADPTDVELGAAGQNLKNINFSYQLLSVPKINALYIKLNELIVSFNLPF